jgi:hypothetical protein
MATQLGTKIDGVHGYTISYYSIGQWLIEVNGCVAGRVAGSYFGTYEARLARGAEGQTRDDVKAPGPYHADRDSAARAVADAYYDRFVQLPTVAQAAA